MVIQADYPLVDEVDRPVPVDAQAGKGAREQFPSLGERAEITAMGPVASTAHGQLLGRRPGPFDQAGQHARLPQCRPGSRTCPVGLVRSGCPRRTCAGKIASEGGSLLRLHVIRESEVSERTGCPQGLPPAHRPCPPAPSAVAACRSGSRPASPPTGRKIRSLGSLRTCSTGRTRY